MRYNECLIYSPFNLNNSCAYLALYNVLQEVSDYIGKEVNDIGVKKIKIYPPRPMILLPACPANVEINFDVSEVTNDSLYMTHYPNNDYIT